MSLTVEQVAELVRALYNPLTQPQAHTAIQRTLEHAQASPQVWSYVAPLLGNADPDLRFFGASSLAAAIANTQLWTALPAEQHQQLKQSLVEWLVTSAVHAYPSAASARSPTAGERVVLRKLAQAVSSLSVRLVGDWPNWLIDLLSRLEAGDGSAGGKTSREGVLAVLQIVVEQLERAQLPNNQRLAYVDSISSSIQLVVSTLDSSLRSDPSAVGELKAAVSCFTSLLNAGQFNHSHLDQLYPLILPLLSNEATTKVACDAVVEILEKSSGLSGSAGVTKFVSRQKCYELVVHWAVSPFVQHSIAAAVDQEEADEDAHAIINLLIAVSTLLIEFLFDPPPAAAASLTMGAIQLSITSAEVVQLFQQLLAVTGFPGHSVDSYSVNELTETIWTELQETCSDEGLVFGPGDGREGRRGKEHQWPVVRQLFTALADTVRRRAQWPVREETKAWPKDAFASFRQYRAASCADMLLVCFYILRDSLTASLVEQAHQQVTAQWTAETVEFEELEATLYALHAIEEGGGAHESPALDSLFGSDLLARLPPVNNVRATALSVIGAYSLWFMNKPEPLLAAATFIVSGLSVKELSPAAARALRKLCDDNRQQLVPHAASFVQVLGGLEGNVDDDELVKVLESVSSVVQALPEGEFVEAMLSLAKPIIAKLEAALHSAQSSPVEARELAIQQLTYLTPVAKGLADPDADLQELDVSFDEAQSESRQAAGRILADARVVDMRARLGGAIEGCATLWADDAEVVQALSDFIKTSTGDAVPSAVGLDSSALLQLVTTALERSVSSVWLGLATTLLAGLGRDVVEAQVDQAMLERVGRPVEAALRVVLANYAELAAMEANPDVVSAFLDFASGVIKHFPLVFAHLPHHLTAVLQFAIVALSLQERFSFQATQSLLTLSIQQSAMASASSAAFNSAVKPLVPAIVEALVAGVGGRVPRSQLGGLAELAQVVLLRCAEQGRPAVQEVLRREGWEWTRRASKEQRERFERVLLSARTGKQCRTAVTDFALICRGLDGSAYAAATSGLV